MANADLYTAWEFAYAGMNDLNRAESSEINDKEILDHLIDAKENFQNALIYIDSLIEEGLE